MALIEALVLPLVLVEDRNHGRPCPRLGDRAEPGIEVGEVLRLLLGLVVVVGLVGVGATGGTVPVLLG